MAPAGMEQDHDHIADGNGILRLALSPCSLVAGLATSLSGTSPLRHHDEFEYTIPHCALSPLLAAVLSNRW